MPEYLLPDVGEGLTEAELVSWKVQVGDTVAVNDVICEIETAKSIVELPSPYAGTVTALLVEVGQTVAVGTPIIAIGDAAAPARPSRTEVIDTNIPPEGNATLVGYGPRERQSRRRPRRGGAEEAGRITAHADLQDAFTPGDGRQHEQATKMIEALMHPESGPAEPVRSAAPRATVRALAKPPVRRLARELGIDLTALTPTGPGGTVTREDVLAAGPAAPASAGAPGAAGAQGARETREPVKGVRKMMAQAMTGSAFSVPHVTEWVSVDVTATVDLVARLQRRPEYAEAKVSPLLLVAKAVLLALRRTPLINSWFDEAAQEVVIRHHVNLGIAAATPRGLVVPNVKGAERMDLPALATALTGLIRTAKEGRTQPAETSGGTFTITNVGVFGIDGGTPIINPGEAAILAVGAIRRLPWVVTAADGSEDLAIRSVLTLALSFDHRHIDGETGSVFLADVAGLLTDPAVALTY